MQTVQTECPAVVPRRPYRDGVVGRLIIGLILICWSLAPIHELFAQSSSVERVSVDSAGVEGDDDSGVPVNNDTSRTAVSADGNLVAFRSDAGNLVLNDFGLSDVFVHDRTTGVTRRVSVDPSGNQANDHSLAPAISDDGKFVAFQSEASNLGPIDTNNARDVYVYELATGQMSMITVNSTGGPSITGGSAPDISSDGRYVAFSSDSPDLDGTFTHNGFGNVYVRDRVTNVTRVVSVASNGTAGNDSSLDPTISPDGRFVIFRSASSNLVANDFNGAQDVFLHDRQTGITTAVSVNLSGRPGDARSWAGDISATSQFVAFQSEATDLIPGGADGGLYIYVRDLTSGTTSRVSVNSNGDPADSGSFFGTISGDGNLVVFESNATNLATINAAGQTDVYVHNRTTGETAIVTLGLGGGPATGESRRGHISADGETIVFQSLADNLVAGDSNSAVDVFAAGGFIDLLVSKSESIDPVVAGSGTGNLTYIVTATNEGLFSVSGVELSEILTFPAGVTVDSITPSAGTFVGTTWVLGNLAMGASETLTVVLTVDASTAPGTDVICDTATVTNINETDGNAANDSVTECTSVVRGVDLAVSKSESVDPVVGGSGPGNLTYVVTVSNTGPAAASGVELSEILTLPAGVVVDSITPSAGAFAGTTWMLGNLAAGASETLTVVLTVDASTVPGTDVICDTAAVINVNETDTNAANDSVTECTSVALGIDLAVSKSESIDPVVAGSGTGNLTYVVTVSNVGSAAASGVELSEVLTLPAGVIVDSITPSVGTFSGTTWVVGNLTVGASETLTVVLTADASTATGTDVICDTAMVTHTNENDTNSTNDSVTECTSVAVALIFNNGFESGDTSAWSITVL